MKISMTKLEKIFGWIFLGATIHGLPYALVQAARQFHLQLDSTQLNITLFCIDFALAVLIFHRFLWNSFKQSIRHPGKTFMWMGIGFAAYAISSNLIVVLTTLLAPDFANANDASIADMLQNNFLPMALCTVVLVPITEETLYRGLVFGVIREKSRLLAYVVSIAFFSVLHIVNYIGTLSPLHLAVSFLQYLPGAAALAFVYDMSDSIWPGILIHSTINMLAVFTMQFMR